MLWQLRSNLRRGCCQRPPPTVSQRGTRRTWNGASSLAGPALTAIADGLRRHNRVASPSARIKLRIALEIGPVALDEYGVSGPAVNASFRMLDAPAFRRQLTRSGSDMGVIVSARVYDTVIRHASGPLNPTEFHRVRVKQKETDNTAWIWVGPRSDYPAQLAASGEINEFFDQGEVERAHIEEFDRFSEFLALSAENPSAAADLLASAGPGPAYGAELAARYGREVRRLQLDLRHERERRILGIRHSLEEELLKDGVDLPSNQLNAMVESLIPRPAAREFSALLATPLPGQPTPPISLNIGQQFITSTEGTIVQDVHEPVAVGPQAKRFLALIDRYGSEEKAALESAIHELEDLSSSPPGKSRARDLLRRFLAKLEGTPEEVEIIRLSKYLDTGEAQSPPRKPDGS